MPRKQQETTWDFFKDVDYPFLDDDPAQQSKEPKAYSFLSSLFKSVKKAYPSAGKNYAKNLPESQTKPFNALGGYDNYLIFNKAFNNHPLVIGLNALSPMRNLMSGKHKIETRSILLNGLKNISGWPEANAPAFQKAIHKIGVFTLVTPIYNLLKIIFFNLPISTLKLGTEIVPYLIHHAAKAGLETAWRQANKLSKQPFSLPSICALSGLAFAILITGSLFLISRTWHFIGRAITSPLEHIRDYQHHPHGKKLAVISLLITTIVYAIGFAALASYALLPALHTLSSQGSSMLLSTLAKKIVNSVNILANSFSFISSPANSLMGITALMGATLAIIGNGVSQIKSMFSNWYHKPGLQNVFLRNRAEQTARIIEYKKNHSSTVTIKALSAQKKETTSPPVCGLMSGLGNLFTSCITAKEKKLVSKQTASGPIRSPSLNQ